MKKIFLITGLWSLFSCACFGAMEIRDTQIESVMNEIVAPLANAANIKLNVRILADDDFNAFVMGGTDVFINYGLIKRLDNPCAVAAVVAHEIGHQIGGHMAHMSARIDAELKRTLIMQALGVGLMAINPSAGAGVMMGSAGIATQSMASFTRDEERLADDMGADLMIQANLDPTCFFEVFNVMQNLNGAIESRINPNNTNHPLTSERIKNMREKLHTSFSETRDQRPEYSLVREKLIGYLGTEKPTSDYGRAIRYLKNGNATDSIALGESLIRSDKTNPYFYELMGDIKFKFGYYDDAVIAYEKSLDLLNEKFAPQIETALALTLTRRNKNGDMERARELSKRAILMQKTPMAFWVLAHTYKESDGRYDYALAEYYNMIKKPDLMKKYAKNAIKKLKKSDPEYVKSDDLIRYKS